MKRHNFYLPEPLVQRAKEFAKSLDISLASLIRKALEEYLNEKNK